MTTRPEKRKYTKSYVMLGHIKRRAERDCSDPFYDSSSDPFYNLAQAAAREQVDIGRVSFIDTLRWLITAEPGEPMPRLVLNPLRPGRCEPRVIKRRGKQYTLMTRPRAELRKRLKRQTVAA